MACLCACRQREDRVAINRSVSRSDRPGKTVMRHLRDFGRLYFTQARVGRHYTDGRVLLSSHFLRQASFDERPCGSQPLAVFRAHAGYHVSRRRTHGREAAITRYNL